MHIYIKYFKWRPVFVYKNLKQSLPSSMLAVKPIAINLITGNSVNSWAQENHFVNLWH